MRALQFIFNRKKIYKSKLILNLSRWLICCRKPSRSKPGRPRNKINFKFSQRPVQYIKFKPKFGLLWTLAIRHQRFVKKYFPFKWINEFKSCFFLNTACMWTLWSDRLVPEEGRGEGSTRLSSWNHSATTCPIRHVEHLWYYNPLAKIHIIFLLTS